MAAFRKALEARYVGDMIMTRPDSTRLEFIAFRREGGAGKWESLPETYPIPPQCMLHGFVAPEAIELPPVDDVPDGAHGGGDMAVNPGLGGGIGVLAPSTPHEATLLGLMSSFLLEFSLVTDTLFFWL